MDVLALLLERIEKHNKLLWEPETVHLKRNEVLHPAGIVHTNIYLVTEGALRIVYNTPRGSDTIRFGYTGSLFTTLDSFLTLKPSVYSVEAIRKASLIKMTRENFLEFINSDTENLRLWNILLSHTIAALLERETDLLAPTPKERYDRVLSRSPQVFREIPHKYIASYLRMAPETLSRLKKS